MIKTRNSKYWINVPLYRNTLSDFLKKNIGCPEALKRFGQWMLRLIWNLVLGIWDFKK
jgi:hypothetical protein